MRARLQVWILFRLNESNITHFMSVCIKMCSWPGSNESRDHVTFMKIVNFVILTETQNRICLAEKHFRKEILIS